MSDLTEKVCTGCKIMKPITDFGYRTISKDGRAYKCKVCLAAYDKARHIGDRKAKAMARAAAWGKKNKHKRRFIRLRHAYGITEREYNERYAAQNRRCQICLTPQEKLCVDHCHTTKSIRGLLCNHCNAAIGHMRDAPDRLRAAAIYLEVSMSSRSQFRATEVSATPWPIDARYPYDTLGNWVT